MKEDWFTKYKLAHRGLHNEDMPENTLPAFENACKHGFAIELDVHDISDGTVIVFHDNDLHRLCGKNIAVKDLKAEYLTQYHIKNTKYTIPTLQQVLDLVDGRVPIMIELKTDEFREKLSKRVYNIIKDYKGKIAVKSFNPFALIWFKKHAPEVIRGMLGSTLKDIKFPYLYKLLIRNLSLYRWIKPDFISYNFYDLPRKSVTKRNLPVITWTIRSPEQETVAFNVASNIIFENYIPSQSQTGV